MVHEFIHNRRSTVLFSDQPIENSKLESLFEATRWVPSSYNETISTHNNKMNKYAFHDVGLAVSNFKTSH